MTGPHLVARPNGRCVHVYRGPLTPSGRFVPRTARTVCRAHTRRLTVVCSLPPSATPPEGFVVWRVCARCSARLSSPVRAGRALPSSRSDWLRVVTGLDVVDVALALFTATTAGEVDAAGHASLLVTDVAGSMTPVLGGKSLHELLVAARTRVHGYPERTYTDAEHARAVFEAGQEASTRNEQGYRDDLIADKQRRVDALGFHRANPTPKPARRRPRPRPPADAAV